MSANAPYVILLIALLILIGDRPIESLPSIQELEIIDVIIGQIPVSVPPVFSHELATVVGRRDRRTVLALIRPQHITPSDGGFVIVTDAGPSKIHVLTETLQLVDSFARSGSGPGEFQSVALQEVLGDTIQLFDHRLQRATRFSLGGSLIDVCQVPVFDGSVTGFFQLSHGRALLTQIKSGREGAFGTETAAFLLLSASTDTLGIGCSTTATKWFIKDSQARGGGVSSQGSFVPFTGSAIVRYVPGSGIYLTSGETPEVFVYDQQGRFTRHIRIHAERPRISSRVRNNYLDQYEERRQREAINPSPLDRDELIPYFPDYPAFWYDMLVDDIGRIWLKDCWDAYVDTHPDGLLYYVIDADGMYLGSAILPSGVQQIQGNQLFGLILDERTGLKLPAVWDLVRLQ